MWAAVHRRCGCVERPGIGSEYSTEVGRKSGKREGEMCVGEGLEKWPRIVMRYRVELTR
jgi:hypothetical protein